MLFPVGISSRDAVAAFGIASSAPIELIKKLNETGVQAINGPRISPLGLPMVGELAQQFFVGHAIKSPMASAIACASSGVVRKKLTLYSELRMS